MWARATDPKTSHEAAAVSERWVGYHRALILQTLREGGRPMAAEEIADAAGFVNHVSVNRRLSELQDMGLIYRTEEKHLNRSGRTAFRYALVE